MFRKIINIHFCKKNWFGLIKCAFGSLECMHRFIHGELKLKQDESKYECLYYSLRSVSRPIVPWLGNLPLWGNCLMVLFKPPGGILSTLRIRVPIGSVWQVTSIFWRMEWNNISVYGTISDTTTTSNDNS